MDQRSSSAQVLLGVVPALSASQKLSRCSTQEQGLAGGARAISYVRNIVPSQKGFDIRARVEGWDYVAEDIVICTEFSKNLLQVLLRIVGALQIDVLVLLIDDENVNHESVAHSIKNALTNRLLETVEAA